MLCFLLLHTVAMLRLFVWIQVAKELQQLQSAFNVNVMSNTDVFCVFPISTSKAEIDETGILKIWFGSTPHKQWQIRVYIVRDSRSKIQ